MSATYFRKRDGSINIPLTEVFFYFFLTASAPDPDPHNSDIQIRILFILSKTKEFPEKIIDFTFYFLVYIKKQNANKMGLFGQHFFQWLLKCPRRIRIWPGL
jgi:hypothetical protein